MVKRGAIEERTDPYYHQNLFKNLRESFSQKGFYFVGSIIKSWSRGDGPREGFYTDDDVNGVPFLRINNLKENSIDLNDVKFITRTVHEKTLKRSQVKAGDLIFAISGTKDNLGTVSIIPDFVKEANLNSALVRLDLDLKAINKEYFCLLFSLNFVRIQVDFIGKGAAQNNLNNREISQIQIPVPSIDIQSQIVAIYAQAYETKRQKEAEAKALLDSIEEYLLKSLGIILPEKVETKSIFYTHFKNLQGKRFDPFYHKVEFDILETSIKSGLYPIQKMGTFLSQINYGASVKSDYVEFGIPFLRISDLERNEINLSEMKYLPESMKKDIGNAIVYEDDFLISRSGTIGVVARVSKEFNGFAYGSFMIKFCLKNDAPLAKDYLSFFLNCELMQKIIFRNKIGAIQGNITIPTIKNFDIPLPSLSIQNEIAQHIQEIRAKAKALEKEAKEILKQAKIEIEKMILGE